MAEQNFFDLDPHCDRLPAANSEIEKTHKRLTFHFTIVTSSLKFVEPRVICPIDAHFLVSQREISHLMFHKISVLVFIDTPSHVHIRVSSCDITMTTQWSYVCLGTYIVYPHLEPSLMTQVNKLIIRQWQNPENRTAFFCSSVAKSAILKCVLCTVIFFYYTTFVNICLMGYKKFYFMITIKIDIDYLCLNEFLRIIFGITLSSQTFSIRRFGWLWKTIV